MLLAGRRIMHVYFIRTKNAIFLEWKWNVSTVMHIGNSDIQQYDNIQIVFILSEHCEWNLLC